MWVRTLNHLLDRLLAQQAVTGFDLYRHDAPPPVVGIRLDYPALNLLSHRLGVKTVKKGNKR